MLIKKELKEQLIEGHLTLKKLEESLAEIIFQAIEQDRERLGQFLPWVSFIKKIDDELNFIRSSHKSWKRCDEFNYGIFNQQDKYIGNIGVHTISWADSRCEIGYWCLKEYEGQGHITLATKLLEGHLFKIGFNRIEIRCSTLNKKSSGIPKRLNYHLDGVLREDSFENGKFRDTFVFSKIKRDR